jgi:hypothetical protein
MFEHFVQSPWVFGICGGLADGAEEASGYLAAVVVIEAERK